MLKEAVLTFPSPLIRTNNTISLDQSITDYINLTGKPDLNLYLLKSGWTMTGLTTGKIDCGGGIAINGSTAFLMMVVLILPIKQILI